MGQQDLKASKKAKISTMFQFSIRTALEKERRIWPLSSQRMPSMMWGPPLNHVAPNMKLFHIEFGLFFWVVCGGGRGWGRRWVRHISIILNPLDLKFDSPPNPEQPLLILIMRRDRKCERRLAVASWMRIGDHLEIGMPFSI